MKEQELLTVKNYLNSFFTLLTGLPAYVWKNFNSASKKRIIQKNYMIIYFLITTKDKQIDDWYMNLLNCYEWRKCYQTIKDDKDDDFNRILIGEFLVDVVLADINNRNSIY